MILLLWSLLGSRSIHAGCISDSLRNCQESKENEDEVSLLQTSPGWLRRPQAGQYALVENPMSLAQSDTSMASLQDSLSQQDVPQRFDSLMRLAPESLASAGLQVPSMWKDDSLPQSSRNSMSSMQGGGTTAGLQKSAPPAQQEMLSMGGTNYAASFVEGNMPISTLQGAAMRRDRMLSSEPFNDATSFAQVGALSASRIPAEDPLTRMAHHQEVVNRAEINRAAESLIEKEAEMEVSHAISVAAEQVRQARAKAAAAMKAQRLNAYNHLAEADAAAESLLSIEAMPMQPSLSPAASRRRKAIPAGLNMTCGPDRDENCDDLTRTVTFGYSMKVLNGYCLWAMILLIQLTMCFCCLFVSNCANDMTTKTCFAIAWGLAILFLPLMGWTIFSLIK